MILIFVAVTLLRAWKCLQLLRKHSYINTAHNKEITWKARAARHNLKCGCGSLNRRNNSFGWVAGGLFMHSGGFRWHLPVTHTGTHSSVPPPHLNIGAFAHMQSNGVVESKKVCNEIDYVHNTVYVNKRQTVFRHACGNIVKHTLAYRNWLCCRSDIRNFCRHFLMFLFYFGNLLLLESTY